MTRLLSPFGGLYEHAVMITGRDVMVAIRRVNSSPTVIFQTTATAAPDGTIDRKNPITWLDALLRREVMAKLRAAYLGIG